MELVIPLIALFVFVGLTQTTLTRRTYMRIIAVILVVVISYYFTTVRHVFG